MKQPQSKTKLPHVWMVYTTHKNGDNFWVVYSWFTNINWKASSWLTTWLICIKTMIISETTWISGWKHTAGRESMGMNIQLARTYQFIWKPRYSLQNRPSSFPKSPNAELTSENSQKHTVCKSFGFGTQSNLPHHCFQATVAFLGSASLAGKSAGFGEFGGFVPFMADIWIPHSPDFSD